MKIEKKPDGTFEFPWNEKAIGKLEDILAQPWPTSEPFVENGEKKRPLIKYEQLTVNYWFDKNNVYNHPNIDIIAYFFEVFCLFYFEITILSNSKCRISFLNSQKAVT